MKKIVLSLVAVATFGMMNLSAGTVADKLMLNPKKIAPIGDAEAWSYEYGYYYGLKDGCPMSSDRYYTQYASSELNTLPLSIVSQFGSISTNMNWNTLCVNINSNSYKILLNKGGVSKVQYVDNLLKVYAILISDLRKDTVVESAKFTHAFMLEHIITDQTWDRSESNLNHHILLNSAKSLKENPKKVLAAIALSSNDTNVINKILEKDKRATEIYIEMKKLDSQK